jgi:DNA-binding transcriptional regulator YiaG
MPTKADPKDPLAALLVWQQRCPIKLWRRDNKVSIRDLAALLDIATGTLQNWEGGNTLPDLENTAKLQRLTRNGDFMETYLAWMHDKPKV